MDDLKLVYAMLNKISVTGHENAKLLAWCMDKIKAMVYPAEEAKQDGA